MPTLRKNRPAVFIVESLSFSDERAERFEGRVLGGMLKFARKEFRYAYIRTGKELKAVLSQFHQSRMRYLHISCHGSSQTINLTLEPLSFDHFGELLRPYIKKRRVFFSACEVVNDDMAAALIPGSGCYSILGPKKAVTFGDAAIMWSSFYHLMFRLNPDAMKGKDIKSVLEKICPTYEVPFVYYRSSLSVLPGYKKYSFR